MKIKNKKTFTKLICSALLLLTLVSSTRMLPVASAAPVADKPKEETETCQDVGGAGWDEARGSDGKPAAPGAFTCFKKYNPTDKENTSDEVNCSSLKSSNPQYTYRRVDAQSLTPAEAAEAGETQAVITCSKRIAAVADSEDLIKHVQVLLGVQQFLNRLIWPVLVLSGSLMENDLLFGNGMEEKLHDIWIPIRNLVNILFVVVLVGLALYNVLGVGDEGGNTSIKSMLPKIVIGIIAVNFSFVAIKVFLDGINAMTVSVFGLPGQVNEGLADVLSGPGKDTYVKKLCAQLEGTPFSIFEETPDEVLKQQQQTAIYQQVAGKEKYKAAGVAANDSITAIKDKIHTRFGSGSATDLAIEQEFNAEIQAKQNSRLCNAKGLTPQGEIFLGKYNAHNAAFALALNMGKIVFYEDVPFNIDNAEKLFVNTLFSLLLYFVYVASFLALFVVLLGRMVVMWLCVAVSPVLLLMMATPSLKDKVGDLGKITEIFTKNALAPLIMSLPLTIGWIMLKAIQSTNLGQSAGNFISNSASIMMDPSNGVPVGGLYTIQDFMMALSVIAVVWAGVFGAASGTIAEGATNWMKEKLLSAGKWIGTLPFKHLPLIPIGLPNHEHAQYTFSQLGHYMENVATRTKDVDKLWREAGGEKTGNPTELKEIHSKEGLLNHLRRAKAAGTLAEQQAGIKGWLENQANNQAIAQLKGSRNAEERKLFEELKRLASGNNTEDAVNRIKANTLIDREPTSSEPPTPPGGPAAGATPPGAAAAPGTAAAPRAGISPDQEIGGTKFSELVTDQNNVRTVNEQKTKIEITLKKPGATAQKKVDIETNIRAIKTAFGSHPLKPVELHDLLGGEEKYNEVIRVLGDGDVAKGRARLDEILPTPPTPPPAAPAEPEEPAPTP